VDGRIPHSPHGTLNSTMGGIVRLYSLCEAMPDDSVESWEVK